MNKPVRLFIYLAILALCGYMLAPALSVDAKQIGAPLKHLVGQWSTLALIGITIGLALLITYVITSHWGLIVLGALAFCGLLILAILHPYLFPLLIPLSALWVACALARRKESHTNAGHTGHESH